MTLSITTMWMAAFRLCLSLLLPCYLLSGISLLAQADIDQPFIVKAQKQGQRAIVVLIIDDMGNSLDLGRRALALPGPVNYAFLPHSPGSKILAESAHQQGKEIMLHIPMSNLQGHTTGPGALRPIMDRQQFLETLYQNLESIPHIRGVNNHMGSLLTQLREPMGWLMAELKQRNLYFIDSRTSPLSVAESQANAHQLATSRRDIFLDNKLDSVAIARQFERLVTLAKEQGIAVAIGHPHPETLEFLEQAIPTLADRGVSLSLASTALNSRPSSTRKCKKPSASDCTQVLAQTKARNDKVLTR